MTACYSPEPPDMAAVGSPPLVELRTEAAHVRATNVAFSEPSEAEVQARRALDTAVATAVRAQAAFDERMPELCRAAGLLDRFRSAMFRDEELEWMVPTSYGWGEVGKPGVQMLGLPIRILEGIDRLYLALKVTP